MKNIKRRIVIFSGFNRARFSPLALPDGAHKVLTEEWIKLRSEIWHRYTWQSLLNQVHKDWVYCLCCDIAAKEITDRHFGDIKDKRFRLTYANTDQERGLMKKLIKGQDELVAVRIDSDDMFHPYAILDLSEALYDVSYDWFLWQEGYGYQYGFGNETGKLKRYKPNRNGSGPFFAHRYRRPVVWANKETIKECQHPWVIKYGPKILRRNRILVGVLKNTSTHINAKCFYGEMTGSPRERVLREFGIL